MQHRIPTVVHFHYVYSSGLAQNGSEAVVLGALNSSEEVSRAQLCAAAMVTKVEMKSSLEADKLKSLNPSAKSSIKSDIVTLEVDVDIKSLP